MYNQIKSIGMHKTLTAHQGLLIIFSPFLMQCHCMGVYILHMANLKHNVFCLLFLLIFFFILFLLFLLFCICMRFLQATCSANLEFASRYEHSCSCFSARSLASKRAVLLLSKQSSLASQQAVLLVLLGRLLLSSLPLSLFGFKVYFSSFLRFFLCPEEDATAFSACKHKKK